jgi:hypothetical protein
LRHIQGSEAAPAGWTRPPLPLSPQARRAAFICFGLMIAAGNFVFAGLAVHLLSILGALGLSERAAIVVGMLVGPAQVIGRIGEMALGPRASPILAARISEHFSRPRSLCWRLGLWDSRSAAYSRFFTAWPMAS